MEYPVRDKWGRPGIRLEGVSGYTYCTRSSTVGKCLDNQEGLTLWKQRMVAAGAGLRPDILAKVQAHWPFPTGDDKAARKIKAEVDGYCEELKEAAAASAGANMGTALHQAFQVWATTGKMTLPPLDRDLKAIIACLERHELEVDPKKVEKTIVVLSLSEPIAGTFDALVGSGRARLPLIFDLKTGQNLDHSWGNYACQLAIYAHGEAIYDWDEEACSDMPEVNQRQGLVLHAPAGQGKAELHVVDLIKGWEGVQRALEVRQWQKRQDLARPARQTKGS